MLRHWSSFHFLWVLYTFWIKYCSVNCWSPITKWESGGLYFSAYVRSGVWCLLFLFGRRKGGSFIYFCKQIWKESFSFFSYFHNGICILLIVRLLLADTDIWFCLTWKVRGFEHHYRIGSDYCPTYVRVSYNTKDSLLLCFFNQITAMLILCLSDCQDV